MVSLVKSRFLKDNVYLLKVVLDHNANLIHLNSLKINHSNLIQRINKAEETHFRLLNKITITGGKPDKHPDYLSNNRYCKKLYSTIKSIDENIDIVYKKITKNRLELWKKNLY